MTETPEPPKKEKKPKFRRGNNVTVPPAKTDDPSINELMEMDTHGIADVLEGNKPPKQKAPNAFKPTDEHRRRVRDLVLCQMKRERIAQLLGISLSTLERHFKHELEHSLDAINSKVAFTMARLAIEGNVRAADFWLRTRAGFTNARDGDEEGKMPNQIVVIGGLPD